jgi:hypothetical protein
MFRQARKAPHHRDHHYETRYQTAGYTKSVRYLLPFATLIAPRDGIGWRGLRGFMQTAESSVHKD